MRKSRKGRKPLTLSCPGDGDHKGILIITRAASKQKGTAANAVNPFRSAHCELWYPGEGLPQLPAVEVFRKRNQLVGIVEHLSVDGTGADHPLFTTLFELVAIHTQYLADLAGREEHRAVTVAQQVFEEQRGLYQHEMRAEQFLEIHGLHQIIRSFCCFRHSIIC